MRQTLISPRYPASMVPGLFTIDRPNLAANPERGWTSPTVPIGSATAIPVPTRTRRPGSMVTSVVVHRSTPASPSWARCGIGIPGSSRSKGMAGRSLTCIETTLDGVSETSRSGATAHGVEGSPVYSERMWVPLWRWPIGLFVTGLLAAEVHMGAPGLRAWLPYVLLLPFPVWALLSLSRLRIEVF